ncbi:hypothetical protein FNV43_RR08576 [Rhamnella rubrinervis]|uniref:Uncharacterized protein n=1 Tax=Rhamnella rubrinervis TaxID=2594499 RepID=A0A8K0H9I2_9ROSA|nr:hypothetical protein FNV43_RR08576 [Rhamnella rubrinervis]
MIVLVEVALRIVFLNECPLRKVILSCNGLETSLEAKEAFGGKKNNDRSDINTTFDSGKNQIFDMYYSSMSSLHEVLRQTRFASSDEVLHQMSGLLEVHIIWLRFWEKWVGLLSLLEKATSFSPLALASAALPILVAAVMKTVLIPDDSMKLVAAQAVLTDALEVGSKRDCF